MKNLHKNKNPKPMIQQAEMCTGLKKNLSSVRGQRGSGNWVSLAGITLCWVVLDNQVCFTDLHIYLREGIC